MAPVTALATAVRGGGPEGLVLRFNRLGIAEVVLQPHTPLLADGVEPADTPGTGSVHGQNTDEALAANAPWTPRSSSLPPGRQVAQPLV